MNRRLAALLILGLLTVCPYAWADLEDEDYGGEDDEDYDGDYGGEDGPGSNPPGGVPAISKHIPGIVDIDPLTFDKVVLRGGPSFVTFYSTEPDVDDVLFIIEEVAEKLGMHLRLVMAKVDVTEDSAAMLRARFGNRKAPFHLYFPDAVSEPVEYKMDVDATDAAEQLESWLVGLTGHPLEIQAFTPLVKKFVAESSQRATILKQAEGIMRNLTPGEALIGKWYLKTMNNMIKKGDGYLEKEFARLDKMMNDQSSMKQDKIDEFGQRREVINIFAGGKFKATNK